MVEKAKRDAQLVDLDVYETDSNSSEVSVLSQRSSTTAPPPIAAYRRVEEDDLQIYLNLKSFPRARQHEPDAFQYSADIHMSNGTSNSTASSNAAYSRKRNNKFTTLGASSFSYHGVNIYQAAGQGSLPLCVLLWGLASAKRVSLMVADEQGNNPYHHAALADTAEQSKGVVDEISKIRLTESRNLLGETALFRAMSVGSIPVVKALLEAGSDPFVFDNMGNTIFTSLAKHGQLWCLNFVYQALCASHGETVTSELLTCVDSEEHSALDWAAYTGNVNIIEYLLRGGMNPYRTDSCGRGPLYWAVKNGSVDAASMLVQCGCDPFRKDSTNQSPFGLACSYSENRHIVSAFMTNRRFEKQHSPAASYAINANLVMLESNAPLKLYHTKTACGKAPVDVSFAINRIFPSRLWHTLVYGVLVYGLWFTSIYTPFYYWIPSIIFIFYGFRYYSYKARCKLRSVNRDRSRISLMQDYLSCAEKGLGLYIGILLHVFTYLFSCISFDDSYIMGQSLGAKLRRRFNNVLGIGGVTAASSDMVLFWVCCGFVVLACALWLKVSWLDPDPGRIDTRAGDFEEIMAQSLAAGGPPPPERYCRTTLVRKPLRSKYCSHVGFVVARMDHYCQWLDNSIGFANHRTFILFLFAHVIAAALVVIIIVKAFYRELTRAGDTGDVCSVLSTLLGREYFFVLTLGCVMLFVFLSLTMLLAEQLYNIATNMTINERINGSRYSWIVNVEGKRRNKFDRGVLWNSLEFLQVKNYVLDYSRVFEVPDSSVSTGGVPTDLFVDPPDGGGGTGTGTGTGSGNGDIIAPTPQWPSSTPTTAATSPPLIPLIPSTQINNPYTLSPPVSSIYASPHSDGMQSELDIGFDVMNGLEQRTTAIVDSSIFTPRYGSGTTTAFQQSNRPLDLEINIFNSTAAEDTGSEKSY